MQSLHSDLGHLIGDRVAPVSGKAIHACSDQELSPNLLRRAKQFVDVAFPI